MRGSPYVGSSRSGARGDKRPAKAGTGSSSGSKRCDRSKPLTSRGSRAGSRQPLASSGVPGLVLGQQLPPDQAGREFWRKQGSQLLRIAYGEPSIFDQETTMLPVRRLRTTQPLDDRAPNLCRHTRPRPAGRADAADDKRPESRPRNEGSVAGREGKSREEARPIREPVRRQRNHGPFEGSGEGWTRAPRDHYCKNPWQKGMAFRHAKEGVEDHPSAPSCTWFGCRNRTHVLPEPGNDRPPISSDCLVCDPYGGGRILRRETPPMIRHNGLACFQPTVVLDTILNYPKVFCD